MRVLNALTLAFTLLPVSRAAADARFKAWRWQRTVQPATTPGGAQCFVLDADLYAHAAPGLRDVRLVQDGREIAYALAESYDEDALGGKDQTSGHADRSLYTTVLRIPLSSTGLQFSLHGEGDLPLQVPVERMELAPVADLAVPTNESQSRGAVVQFRLSAMPSGAKKGQLPEVIEDKLPANRTVEMATIGANLQTDAEIIIDVNGNGERFSVLLLQMHQRSICYQPLSNAALTLYFGNTNARPVHYDYAMHYRPTPTPLLARLEPRQANPAYQPPVVKTVKITRIERLVLALGLAIAAFLFTAVPLLRRAG